ncbi:hypothetical protein, partial [Herbaspirillum sp. C7C8]|uniref:hypothetical protein n=1 Tax=Herbaspirillum sp. C7C8 TaxID=2736665 RepID=UPI001F51F978
SRETRLCSSLFIASTTFLRFVLNFFISLNCRFDYFQFKTPYNLLHTSLLRRPPSLCFSTSLRVSRQQGANYSNALHTTQALFEK